MRVLRVGQESHDVDHVDHANFELRQVTAQDIDSGQRLECRHVPGAGHDNIRLTALIAAGPAPDADPGGAVLDRCFHT